MREKQYILFDLDGTLTDPKVGITKSVQYALQKQGIVETDLDQLCPFIGPPLAGSFQKFYGMSEEESLQAVEDYREYFRPTGIFENSVYPGIPQLLDRLVEAGKGIVLATSKPTVFAEQILEHFELTDYFDLVSGSELDGRRVEKEDVIRYALEEMMADPAEIVMVGDRCFDIEGAHACGIEAIGVLFGYGGREELERAGADLIVENVAELTEVLLGTKAERASAVLEEEN